MNPNHTVGKSAKTRDVQLTQIQSSLLPPSNEMEKYESFHPGSTEKLFNYISKEQDHRHKLDHCFNWNIIRGQILALVSLFGLLGLAAYSFHLNMPWAGCVVGAFSVVGIISAFLNIGKKI